MEQVQGVNLNQYLKRGATDDLNLDSVSETLPELQAVKIMK
jgi:hypothetical protein